MYFLPLTENKIYFTVQTNQLRLLRGRFVGSGSSTNQTLLLKSRWKDVETDGTVLLGVGKNLLAKHKGCYSITQSKLNHFWDLSTVLAQTDLISMTNVQIVAVVEGKWRHC